MSRPTKQRATTLEELNQLVRKHVEERDWHNNPPRSLAISIALEAGELLEHYQWSDKAIGSKEELAAELADILIYAFQFADREGIDIADAVRRKLQKAAEKYPAEQFKGKQHTEMHDNWLNAHLSHKKEGL